MNDKKPVYIERRKPERFQLRVHATLVTDKGKLSAYLLDLSNEGAMIALTEEHTVERNHKVTLSIELGEDDTLIMQGKVIHVKEHYLGLECQPAGTKDQTRLTELIKDLGEDE